MVTAFILSNVGDPTVFLFWYCTAVRAVGAALRCGAILILTCIVSCCLTNADVVVRVPMPQSWTTQHGIWSKIEAIRSALRIERFILFGGSWGATLALIYAISHPTRVRQMVLRGVFLSTKAELDWFYGGGAGAFFPELWAKLIDPIPQEERGDLIAAYQRRLFSGDTGLETRMAQLWSNWENALASIHTDGYFGTSPAEYARAFARLESHYFLNGGFLEYDGWILANRDRIEHIPAEIVQGRYDLICPPISAHKLALGWPMANLRLINLAGHALSEPGISEALVSVMNALRP